MRAGASFDVLVVGSGASGLAAAVAAERAGAGSASRPRRRCRRATRRRRRAASRPRSARTTRPRSMPRTSCGARTRRRTCGSSRCSRARRRRAIHWLEELAVEFTRANGGYRLARCGGASASACSRSATAPATRSRRRCARPTRRVPVSSSRTTRLRARAVASRLARAFDDEEGAREVEAGAVVLAAGGRCFAEAEERGELSTNHPTRPAR